MRKRIITVVLAFGLSLLLVQCATKQDMQNLDFRMRYLDNKIIDLDQNLKKIAGRSDLAKKETVEIVQKQQANTGETLERMHADLLQLSSDVDEMNHNFNTLKEDDSSIHDQIDGQINGLSERIEELTAQLDKVSSELSEIKIARANEASERALEAARAVEIAKGKKAGKGGVKKIMARKHKKTVKKGAGKSSTKTSKVKEPGMDIYNKAYSLYKRKKYKKAFREFSKYIDTYPNGRMFPNARFWLADTLYNQKEYELAILEYQKVIDNFPKHEKAPAALLKEGFAFEKLKDNMTAKIVYEKMLADYPNSEQAKTAKQKLSDLR